MADDTIGRTDIAQKMVPAPPHAVYQALTQPDLLMRWLPPTGMSGRVELFEPFEGGRYRYVLRYDDAGLGAGKTSADEDAVEGRFTELVPAARVVQTARFQSDDPAFAGEMRQVVLPDEGAVGVLPLDGAEGRRRGEQGRHLVLFDDAPERAGIGRADGLALEQYARAAGQQRRVDDVGMADHPADIGCGPEHLARLHAELVAHRPVQRHHVPAIVAHHALGLAGRAGGVEHIERVRCRHRYARHLAPGRLGLRHRLAIVMVAPLDQIAALLLALKDQAGVRLVIGKLDRLVEQRLVGDHPPRLDAARSRYHHLRARIVDAGCQFFGREPTEHHRMDRAQPRAGQHRDRRFGHHRHVEYDAVAARDAEIAQHRGQGHDLVLQL